MNYKYIYTFCLSLSLLLVSNFAKAQGETCIDATPFCIGIPIDYPAGFGAGVTAPAGPDYGCLFSQPNPAWFFLEADNPGAIDLEIQRDPPRDIDFAIWGPFAPGTTVASACTQIFAGTLAPNDCSFAGTTLIETPSINPTLSGQVYILMITNFSNAQTDLTLTQASGTGTTSCAVLCGVDAGSPVSACGVDGSTVLLTADVANFTTGWTYQWYKDGILIPGATSSTYAAPTPSVATTVTNLYRVQATNPTLTCSDQDTVSVTTISSTSSFTVDLGADVSRCDAVGGLTLNAAHPSHGGAFTYQWSLDGTPIGGATNSTLAVNFTSAGGNAVTRTYTVAVTDPSPTGCTRTDDVDVTFVPDPVVALGADIVACDAFGVITLDAGDASHGATISYQWFENGTPITGATNATLNVSFPSGGAAQTRTYRAEVTDSRGSGCTQFDEVDVTFKPSLAINIGQNFERCENVFNFTINASDATHSTNMTYQLFTNGVLTTTSTNPLFAISINDAAATTIQTRTYRVIATDNTGLGCAVTSSDLVVTYNHKPLIAPIADRIDIDCAPNVLTAQISNYPTDDSRLRYSWIYTGANVQYEVSSNATVVVNNGGTYTLTVATTLANGTICTSVESFIVQCKVSTNPAAQYVPILTGQAGYSVVDLEWTLPPAEANVSQFEVYMGINDEPSILLALTTDNFKKVDLVNGVNYSFRVRPIYRTTGAGLYSNTVILKPSIVLGQDETDRRAAISIFPNPSNGSFTLEFKAIQAQKANLTIVDLTGKVILTQSLSDLDNGSQQNIELGAISNGVYIVQVQTEKGVYQQKITIVK